MPNASSTFMLNQKVVTITAPYGVALADIVREQASLLGTKIACREGDCGACCILCGEIIEGQLTYRLITSCISPFINSHGKHIVTIEGLKSNQNQLNPVQQKFVDEGATQCGFCTPGFIMAIVYFFLTSEAITLSSAIQAIDGNICRCTGYKSIERAIAHLVKKYSHLQKHPPKERIIPLINEQFIPEYFATVSDQLLQITSLPNISSQGKNQFIGGGTDLLVQKPHAIRKQHLTNTQTHKDGNLTLNESGEIILLSNCRIEDLRKSDLIHANFPFLRDTLRFFASTPIRHQGTIMGNLVNASPIGDISIILLALDATLDLHHPETGTRTIPLRKFYQGYKKTALLPSEKISSIRISMPKAGLKFNFEKISKRKFLDIASVNTCLTLVCKNDFCLTAAISAGGIAPIPLYLEKTSAFLCQKTINSSTIRESLAIADQEISPISDARGSEEYKRKVLKHLLLAHFQSLTPQQFSVENFL